MSRVHKYTVWDKNCNVEWAGLDGIQSLMILIGATVPYTQRIRFQLHTVKAGENMKLRLTNTSLSALLRAEIQHPQVIRVSAEYEGGGCGCVLDVTLRVDTGQDDDIVLSTIDNVPIVTDPTSEMLMDADTVNLDFIEGLGYVLRSPNETIAYGIKLDTSIGM